MNRRLYLAYVIIVVLIVLVAGHDEDNSRNWGNSSGHSGWSSGGGHK